MGENRTILSLLVNVTKQTDGRDSPHVDSHVLLSESGSDQSGSWLVPEWKHRACQINSKDFSSEVVHCDTEVCPYLDLKVCTELHTEPFQCNESQFV